MGIRLNCLRRHIPFLLLWTALWGLFFAPFLVGREWLSGGDFVGQFYFFGLFQARQMAQGHLPVWAPGNYAGFPFAADTQAAAFYLPRWVTILLSSPWQFPFYALELEAFAHIWLAGVFTYALAYTITRKRLAALTGAVAFALGGYLASYPLSQLSILETVTWLPLILLLLRIGIGRSNPAPWLMGAGLVWALSATAGHPQTLLHISYLAAAYYLFLAVRARWRWSWILGLGALVTVVAVGTAAVSWLPALRFAMGTTRSDVSYEFVASGLPMLNYVHVLTPGIWADIAPEYLGVTVVFLIVLAWWGRRRTESAEVVFWAGAALVAAWLALGDAGVLFQLVYHVAPGFSLFRRQERLLGVFSLSGALLAAQGLAVWVRADDGSRREMMRRAALIVGVGMLVAGLVLALASNSFSRPWLRVWGRQLVVAALAAFLLWGGRWPRWRGVALILLLAGDLYPVATGAIEHRPGPPPDYGARPAWVKTLRSDEPSRIDTNRLFYANVGTAYGLEDIRGLSPLEPQALEDLEKLPKSRRWQLLNVKHVLATEPPDEVPLTQVGEIAEHPRTGQPLQVKIYRFEEALPRAWLSYHPISVADSEAALQRLADPAFDPRRDVVLHTEVEGAEAIAPADASARSSEVQVSRLGPSALRMRVTTGAPAILVISEWYYPGWRARIDGRPVPLHPANYAFQAVVVPAGEHSVEVRFVPLDVWVGVAISLGAMLAAAVLAWRWKPSVPQRRLTPPRSPAVPASTEPQKHQLPWSWLVLCLVLLGFGLRLIGLGAQELRGDEAFSYLFIRLPTREIIPALSPVGEPHSPFHYFLLHGWTLLAGTSEFSMRYIALFAGVLVLPLMFQLGRRIEGEGLGLLLVGLTATSQSLIWASQDVRNHYAMVMLFSALATLLLVEAIRRPKWHRWGAYAAACTLTLHSHYYGVFVPLAHGLHLIAVPERRKRLWAWAASVFGAFLTLAPWVIATFPQMARHHLGDVGRPQLAPYLTSVGTELTVGSAFDGSVARWLFLGALGLCLIGARELFGRQRGWASMLTGWLTGATLVIFLVRFRRSIFNPYYILVVAPAWWMLLGKGVTSLLGRRERWRRAAAAVGVVGLLASSAVSLTNYYTKPECNRTNGYRGVAAHVAAEAAPGELFIRNFPDPTWAYYLEDVPVEQVMQPEMPQADAGTVGQALSELAAQHDRLWFVPYRHSVWDSQGVVLRWLDAHCLLERKAAYQNLTLFAFRPMHTLDRVMKPVNLSLDGELRLEAAFVTIDGEPALSSGSPLVLSPGSQIGVTLLWQALTEVSDGYTVFVHLLDEDGQLLTQHDGWPVRGTCPTFTWKPGQRLLDPHEMTLPPGVSADRGRLVVGMYNSDTLERQVFAHGRDAIWLADVRFEAR